MFLFAYDGSINGDWVSHYAIQLAAAHAERCLTLVHVRDQQAPGERLAENLQRMRRECEHQEVQLVERLLPAAGGRLFETLRAAIPPGPEHYLVCGTRALEGRTGGLIGTTTERWLRSGHCNVLALRVVQPGVLGAPRRLLIPVTERSGGFGQALPFLRLLGPQVTHLHLVLVARVGRRRLHRLSHERTEHLRGPGRAYCAGVEREIVAQLGLGTKVMDAQVVVSDDIAREILIAANRTKSRLIYMGASGRNPTQRLLLGDPVEQVLRGATCDVAIYRGAD